MKTFLLLLLVVIIALFLIKRKDMTWRQSFLKTIYPLIMLKSKWFPDKGSVQLNDKKAAPPVSFHTLQATANDGTVMDFSEFKGKKVLIVNTASDCGFTGQYAELEKLYKRYRHKLVILGFPANDFKDQEKKADAEIAAFCKLNFGVTFPLMQKTHVKGAEQNKVFQWLTDPAKNGWCRQRPMWNFSKYVVDEKGILLGFFGAKVSPLDEEITAVIE